MKPVSLRYQLMRATTICLALVLITAYALTAFVLNTREEALIDSILDEQIQVYIDNFSEQASLMTTGLPRMLFYKYKLDSEEAAQMPTPFHGYSVGNHDLDIDDKEYHFVVRDEGGQRFILALDVEQYEDGFTELMVILAASFLLTLLLSLTAIYILSKRTFRSMEALVAKVRSPDEKSFQEEGMEEEILALARVLDDYRTRQLLLLEREQEFSAQLSHELRTPLSVVRAQAEMIQDEYPHDGKLVNRAQAAMDQVDKMRLLMEQLLRIARSQRSSERRKVWLHEIVSRIWSDLEQGSHSYTRLDNRLEKQTEIMADPLLLELVLRNVMSNARLHANGSLFTVSYANGTLVMEDSESEITEKAGRNYQKQERGRKQDDGQGIGLSILERACGLSGWHYEAVWKETGLRIAIGL